MSEKQTKSGTSGSDASARGHDEAIALLRDCLTDDGFVATPIERHNYHRVWGRDGGIISLAALLSGDEELIDGSRRTLATLARHQGPHGEIPSNVDARTERVSYGGTAGRVDADLWFLIGCGRYWQFTGDEDFLHEMLEPMEKVRALLGAWEFNTRGLLYVPLTGDWSDEYIHGGYVLYDQLLYLQAQRELCAVHRGVVGSADYELDERARRLKRLIDANYWLRAGDELPEDVYHEVLYRKGRRAAKRCCDRYWTAFFSPVGYGYRFDTLANALASLIGVAGPEQAERVDEHIENEVLQEEAMVLPAFHPVITPKDEDWEELHMTFSYTFKNRPYEYHNGGLWPLVTGFYVADLAARGRTDRARSFLDGIHRANATRAGGSDWSFPEYLHGKTFQPGGTMKQGWSGAAAVIGHHALEGRSPFAFLRDDG
ncbi:MAG: glycoside hydrolase 100 family protein [Planctomycetota bacterium]|nr:glycoside hydrolase 100 family protein [Planctomycetota bacterium]